MTNKSQESIIFAFSDCEGSQKIRFFLSSADPEKVIHDLCDYCNSLCSGLGQEQMLDFQRIQNTAAWLLQIQLYQIILHIIFVDVKHLLIMFKALCSLVPSGSAELLCQANCCVPISQSSLSDLKTGPTER